MNFQKAGVADIIRKSQKDEQFIERYNNALVEFLRLTTSTNENNIKRCSSKLSQISYYLLTSLSNLQTLGEEYTTIIRYQRSRNAIPSRTMQVLWLLLYVCGKDAFFVILDALQKKINKQNELRSDTKSSLIKTIKWIKNNENLFTRFHLAIFYLQEKYYDIANRLTGIQYVSWEKNDEFSRSFNILGTISLGYLLSTLIYNIFISNKETMSDEPNTCSDNVVKSSRECFLCAEENIKATSLNCGHYYCWKCVFDLVSYRGKCPICRETIDRNSIVMLENF